MARKDAKGQRKVARETAGHDGHVAKQDTLQHQLVSVGEEEREISEEAVDNEEELIASAWCLLEESAREQWQEVISRKRRTKTEEGGACLTAECGKRSVLDFQEHI